MDSISTIPFYPKVKAHSNSFYFSTNGTIFSSKALACAYNWCLCSSSALILAETKVNSGSKIANSTYMAISSSIELM